MKKNDLIVRKTYLDSIKPFMNINMVKIITGVRRCGKSYILYMIEDELLKNHTDEGHIISKLYTSMEFPSSFSQKEMYEDLKKEIKDEKKYYLLLDEIQEIDGWEKVINTFLENYNVDIYVTGSNSKLTSENISTYLSGRYILIPVYTLSFKEYLEFKKISFDQNLDDTYLAYIKDGGFPLIATSCLDDKKNYQIIEGIYHSIINKDVLTNHPIKEIDKFNRVVNFIMDNMGKTFSANSIAKYLKSQNREISIESVYNYLTWLQESFIIYQCNRINLQGKTLLKTQEKYYLSDISLRYGLYGYNNTMNSAILENVIYLELKRRGYDVYIGKYGDQEIDFIARNKDDEIQIQATVSLPNNSNREIDNLLLIKDYHHKYVVTTNRNDVQNVNGIQVIHIVDFLLADKW